MKVVLHFRHFLKFREHFREQAETEISVLPYYTTRLDYLLLCCTILIDEQVSFSLFENG
jgi:hypothetical protein